ncbi:hypothetical protein OROGR_007119 [Orobanche gracilis]
MPLVRVEVRNEYALGAPELYRETNKEDPKEVLEGVAVAGLVGVLRQLGDLAEFAAEVFHGLQEEVMRTSSRSHKLMARVQRIETALSPLEKVLLAQRSHLHFAYTAGSNWKAQIRCQQNHFIYSDVPQFIMDTYEDSRGPPRLHLLDKFDPGGPGSCLKRYSDPTFFKRASVASGEASADRTSKDKKGCKVKIRRSWTRSREVSRDASFSFNSSRMHSMQENVDGRSTASQTSSTYDAAQRSDLVEQTTSNLRNGSVYVKGNFHPFNLVQPEEQEYRESISSSLKKGESDFLDYNFLEEKVRAECDDIEIYPSQEQAGCSSSSATWDEKNETQEPNTLNSDNEGMRHCNINKNRHLESFSPDILDLETASHNAADFTTVDEMDIHPCDHAAPALESDEAHFDDIESETGQFMDALDTIESECDTDNDCIKMQQMELNPKLENKGVDEGVCEIPRHNLERQSSSSESNDLADSSLINDNCGNSLFSISPKSLHATKWNEDEFNLVLCEVPIHNLERQSSSSESNDLANSSLLNGNCGNSLISLSPNSLHATNLNGDEFDSVSCEVPRHNLERRSSSSESNDLVNSSLINGNCGNSLLSLSPKSLHATNPNGIESNLVLCEVTRHNLEYQSSSSETAFVISSLINGNCGNNLISLSPKSLHATNSSGDEFNSVLCGSARHNLELQISNSEFNDSSDSSLIGGNCGNNLISLSPKNLHATNSDGDEFNLILCEVDRHNLECQSSCSESNDLAGSSLINDNCGNTLISLSPKSLHATNSNRGESNSVFLVDKDLQLSQMDGDSWTCSSPSFDSREENDNTSAGSNLESISCTESSHFMDNNPGLPITDGTRAIIDSQKHFPGTSSVSSVTFWTNGGLLGLQPSKPPDCSILNAKDAWQENQTERFKHIEEDLNTNSSTSLEHQESSTSVRKTLWEIPPADLDTKLRKLCDSVPQYNSNITGSNTTSSRMFDLSNKLLPTGSEKKLLSGKNQNFSSELRNYPTISNRTFSGRTKVLSPSSSPPLAHMKVSFQPKNGLKTSKLKLKFPNRNTGIENGSDTFPSFQLVPEVPITWQHSGSDSDADTFCRSSPSLSGDDSHSNQSESNSEQWESSESPTCTDCDLYDSLRRISFTESVSTVLENRLQNCASCCSFDIQSSGATNNSFIKGLRDDISLKGFVESQFVPTPAPSPLPPVEWQKSEAVLTNSVSTVCQTKPALFNGDRIDSMDVQKRKSFNLRPMVTTKPTVPSGGSANDVQITAILERAKAIRQAVGSDGEDDGHWSEA